MARSLGLGPGTGAREEGAYRRGSAACSFIFMAYFFFSCCSTLEGGWGIRLQQNRSCRAAYHKPLKGGWKRRVRCVCLSSAADSFIKRDVEQPPRGAVREAVFRGRMRGAGSDVMTKFQAEPRGGFFFSFLPHEKSFCCCVADLRISRSGLL